MEKLSEVYGAERAGRKFGFRDKVYSGGWHRGLDVRKQVASKAYSISHDVLAISDGRVVWVGRPNEKIGLTIVVERADGWFESHSHLTGAVVSVGEKVHAGEKLARTALSHERPGTSWAGPHDHVVFSRFKDGAWNTSRAVSDPAPFIAEALKPKKAVGSPAATVKYVRDELVWTPDSALLLRAEPSKSGKVLARVPHKSVVRTGKAHGEFIEAKFGDVKGFVAHAFTWWVKREVNAKKGVNVRAKASVFGKRVGGLVFGTDVKIIGISGSWRQVTAGRVTGWVHGKHLS